MIAFKHTTFMEWHDFWKMHAFFISNTFISNARLKLAKNQAKAKQHPEAELSLFKNDSLFSTRLSSKNNRRYSKKCTKSKCVCFNEVIWLLTMKIGLKVKNRSYRYDINRPRPRQKLSRSFMKKLSNTEAELKKSVACKKKRIVYFLFAKRR